MNNIFIKFVDSIKEPVKLFKTNNKSIKKYNESEEFISDDPEPKLYSNTVGKNNIIKIFEEYEYSDDLIYSLKPPKTCETKLKSNDKCNLLPLDEIKLYKLDNLNNNICLNCGLLTNNNFEINIKKSKYVIYNTIKYNNLKGIYTCGCTEKKIYKKYYKFYKKFQ